MANLVALVLAKGESKRLRGKNTKDFHGEPMFLVNVKKCLRIFDEVYVSSDDNEILNLARMAGARPIWRDEELCGETPNITVYKHATREMGDVDGIVAVQACSPTVAPHVILKVKQLLELGVNEVMTSHPVEKNNSYHARTYPLYGSVWGLSKWKLENYGDPYDPEPEVLVVDNSVDIHTYDDYQKALRQHVY
jgi:CMP-N-acetylneuraminic acid synthetase